MATRTHTSPDSYYEHGTPRRTYGTYGTLWYRTDTFYTTQYADLNGQVDVVRCAHGTDDSPFHSANNYDPACACCWLGHGHTEQAHTRLITATP